MERRISLIDDFFGGFDSLFSTKQQTSGYRIQKSDAEVTIELDVPGSRPEDVEVNVEGSNLRIDWKRKSTLGEETNSQLFKLSNTADATRVQAKVEHGILTLKIPRQKEGSTRVKVLG